MLAFLLQPIFVMIYGALFMAIVLKGGEKILTKKDTKKALSKTFEHPISHHTWSKNLHQALDKQTLDTIDYFDPHTLQQTVPAPKTKVELTVNSQKPVKDFMGYTLKPGTREYDAEMRKRQRDKARKQATSRVGEARGKKVYLYNEYELEKVNVEADGEVIATYAMNAGVGEPKAERTDVTTDGTYLKHFWCCTKHSSVRMWTASIEDYNRDQLPDIAEAFKCEICTNPPAMPDDIKAFLAATPPAGTYEKGQKPTVEVGVNPKTGKPAYWKSVNE